MANFDLSIAPNADFYEYATGGWQKTTPETRIRAYGSFDILRDNNETRINELFAEMAKTTAAPAPSNRRSPTSTRWASTRCV